MNVQDWLRDAANTLADAMISSARLDAEIILAHTLGRPRTWLHAHPEYDIDPRRIDIANARVELRLERVPIAYIIGHKEFYGRRFMVTPEVLIPRPDSEALIELAIKHMPTNARHLIDVGTGSGCLGISMKLLYPELDVTLSDISKDALKIAKQNAGSLKANVRILQSDLLASYPLRADMIIANLPYLDSAWEVSSDTNSEPDLALYADHNGLKLAEDLIEQLPKHTKPGSVVVLEADLRQHDRIIRLCKIQRLSHSYTLGLGMAFVMLNN